MTEPNQAWRYVIASETGTSHLDHGLPCQDAAECRIITDRGGQPILICVAADGAGSASHSQHGAQAACAHFVAIFERMVRDGLTVETLTETHAADIVSELRGILADVAESLGVTSRNVACTLLGAVVDPGGSAYLQVGDGVIVVGVPEEPNEYAWIFWPERGEYANTTTFVTDPESHKSVQFESSRTAIRDIALMTDGLQPLALNYQERAASPRFFGPLFAPVRAASATGRMETLSSQLAAFLRSPRVQERADDDLTLILASRATSP